MSASKLIDAKEAIQKAVQSGDVIMVGGDRKSVV